MAQDIILVGNAPNDGLGDPVRTAFQKCNSNFAQLFATGGVSGITNGTSNVNIPLANSNVTISVGGVDDVLVVQSGGANIAGFVNATGDLTVDSISASGNIYATSTIETAADLTAVTVVATGNAVLGNATVSGSLNSGALNVTGGVGLGTLSVTGAATFGGNVTSPLVVDNTFTATGNINTTAYYIGDGSQLTGVTAAPGNIFNTITVGNVNIVAESPNDTLVLEAGTNIVLTGNATADSIEFATTDSPTFSGTVTASGGIIGDLNGSVFADDSTLIIDAIDNKIFASEVITTGLANIGGRLDVGGELEVQGATTIAGNLTVSGNITYIGVEDLTVEAPLIYLAANNVADLDDIGLVGNYDDGTPYHTGIARDHTDGVWKLFDQVVAEPTTVIDWANAIYPSFKSGPITSTSTITATGTATAGNLSTAGTVTGASLILSGSITGATTGAFSGNVSTANLNVTGDLVTSGDLTVGGNLAYVNVTTLAVEDPLISLGRGANNTPLVSDDNKDRGTIMYYYSGSEKTAFVGWDDSAGKIVAATDTSVSGEVVTVSNYGNIVLGNIETAGTVTATGNITGGNLITGGTFESSSVSATGNVTAGNAIKNDAVTILQTGAISGVLTLTASGNISGGNVSGTRGAFTNLAGTLETAAQTNITSVGTLSSLSVTGNVTAAYFDGNGSLLDTLTGANVSGTVANATYATSAGTATTSTTAGTVTTAAQPNITSVGTLTSLTVTGNITGGNLITAGLASVSSIVKTGTTGVGNIGSVSNTFDTVFAEATSAQYADLAENYVADADYQPGHVLEFGGDYEVTSASPGAKTIAGVVSTYPAHLMNAAQEGEFVVAVALLGRVPCKVRGSIRKGNMLVSDGGGYAVASPNPEIGSVIGKSLEDHDGEGVIEIVVGRI